MSKQKKLQTITSDKHHLVKSIIKPHVILFPVVKLVLSLWLFLSSSFQIEKKVKMDRNIETQIRKKLLNTRFYRPLNRLSQSIFVRRDLTTRMNGTEHFVEAVLNFQTN